MSHKAHIGQRLGVGDMVSHLSGEIQTGFTYLLQLIPNVDPDGVVSEETSSMQYQHSPLLGVCNYYAVLFWECVITTVWHLKCATIP